MPNLDTLDTIIAIIVVLLVLSLIVQAIQSFIKKMFRLKSREIEKSLTDLFEHVIDKTATATTAANSDAASPTAGAGAASATARGSSKELVATVLGEFQKVGRYTKRGRVVLDSISKEDLLKILARVDSTHFYADYVTKFQAMYADIEALEREMNRLITNDPPLLQGVASARFAEMQEVLSPLINDIKNIVSGNAVKPDVLFGDLLNLRRVKLNDALQLLAAAQEAVASDIKAEREAGNKATVALLQQLSTSLSTIAGLVGQLSQRMDAAFASLRTKLDHVEVWYDTVMQSFEERYTRQMKSVALYISIVVVVFLNASFFRIYSSIATNDLQRALIIQEGQDMTDKARASLGGNNANATRNAGPSGTANSNPGGAGRSSRPSSNLNAAAPPGANPSDTNANAASPVNTAAALDTQQQQQPSASSSPDEPTVTTQEVEEQRQVIEDYVDKYEGFGFAPLTWQQVKTWAGGLVAAPLSGPWWAARRQDFSTLLGWTMMVLLLSVGAPFWQDTLESLFGVKNLLRKKSDTKNVEKESGAGQPRS
jgi:hypothetical protein